MNKLREILCFLGFHSIRRKFVDWILEQEIKGYTCYGNKVYMDLKRTGCKWCNHIESEKRFYIGTKIDVPLNNDLMYKKLVNKVSLEDVMFFYNN